MSDLKPCPFCGSEAKAVYDGDYYADYEFSVRCQNPHCAVVLPASGFIRDGEPALDERDIKSWNQRVQQTDDI